VTDDNWIFEFDRLAGQVGDAKIQGRQSSLYIVQFVGRGQSFRNPIKVATPSLDPHQAGTETIAD
jgi:hypothetical protein